MRVLIIPAAGKGTRFANAGFLPPKPLIPVPTVNEGEVMLTAAIRPFLHHVDDVSAILSNGFSPDLIEAVSSAMKSMVTQEEAKTEGELRCERVGGQLIYPQDGGAALSVLCMQGRLHDASEVIIANSDQVFAEAAVAAWMAHIDAVRPHGSILTFPVTDPADTRWSFVMTGCATETYSEVRRVVEKEHVSDEATCGAYYFASWGILRAAICAMVAAKDRTNNEFYLAPAYNYVEGLVTAFRIDASEFSSLGTPELLAEWCDLHGSMPAGPVDNTEGPQDATPPVA